MKTIANLYNPHEQSKEALIAGFVVRLKIFDRLFSIIKDSDMQYPEQHYLIEAQRGMGKTTLLLRLSYEVENDEQLNSWLIPLVFKEESYYGINRLFKLWEHCADLLEAKQPLFNGLRQQMQALPNEGYERACFALLIQALEAQEKKLLLFIDNIGEMFRCFDKQESQRLREVLLSCSHVWIFGATSVTLESYFDYRHPFYEFFKKVSLPNLNKQETHQLLHELARDCGEVQTIENVIKNQAGRVESLRILTGGVVRSIVLLFELFLDNNNGDSIKDLEVVLDRVTPLYKHRMDDLDPLQREVVDAIALQWDAITPEEIAVFTRRDLAEVLAVLKMLEKLFIIQRVATDTSIDYYQLQERFFNIWYLMRLAPNASQAKVLWLVRFLQSWYDVESLKLRAERHINALQKGNYYPKAAYYFAEAMAATGQLDENTQHELLQKTKVFLAEKNKELMQALSKSDKELFEQAEIFYYDGNYQQVIDLLLQIKQKETVYSLLGLTYKEIQNYTESERYYLMGVEKSNFGAENGLAWFYFQQKKQREQAIKLAEQAVNEEKNIYFTHTLACIYLWTNHYSKATKQAAFFLHEEEYYQKYEEDIVLYLMLLLAKQQYLSVADYFNTADKDYKERFKPLYYALLKLEDDPAYQKHPPELAEPIADILKKIEQLQKDYA